MPADRGELLYSTHCIGCHDANVHWRSSGLVTDPPSLVGQVQRWQRNTGLGWSPGDVDAVVRYLNARYYRFAMKPS